ncbi:MAG: hypothetical protein Q9175_003729 [Cornicularia normoerica]
MSSQQPPIKISTAQTEEEKKNIAVVLDYMSTAYSPENNKGRSSVAHISPLDYADSHAKVMSAIADLKLTSYDVVFAKDEHVLLSGKKAKWTAAAIFEVKNGKVHSFTKEWDKLNMWKQLGWMKGDEYV